MHALPCLPERSRLSACAHKHSSVAVQGNCSKPVDPERELDPVPKFRQCVLTVREDFLEATLIGSRLWLSNLYVTLPATPGPRNHSALIATLGPDIYMTDMAFVADGRNARALDVGGDRRVFISRVNPPARLSCVLRAARCAL